MKRKFWGVWVLLLVSALMLAAGGCGGGGSGGSAGVDAPKSGTIPAIGTTSLPDGMVGTVYSQTLFVTRGTAPITWTIASGVLPFGFNLNSATGVISGTPVAVGTSDFTVRATNRAGSAFKALSISIAATTAPPSAVPPTITTTSLPDSVAGAAYSQTLFASGTAPITWTIASGALPLGLNLNSATGVISGTPTAVGASGFSVQATNSAGSATKALSITITASTVPPSTEPPTITTTSLPDGIAGIDYSQPLSASGIGPITWTIASGDLPSGLSLNTVAGTISGVPTTIGVIVGIPATVGTSSFTIQATNSAGSTTKALSITIAENAAAVTAEVSAIISNLQATASAALQFSEDYPSSEVPTSEDLKPYVGNPNILNGIRVEAVGEEWWAGFNLEEKSSRVKDGLKVRAEAAGLYGDKNLSVPYVDQDIVWIRIRAYIGNPSKDATEIITILREAKAATMMFYADSMDEVAQGAVPTVDHLKRYTDVPSRFDDICVEVTDINWARKWFVGYNLKDLNLRGKSSRVKDVLKSRAKSTGLLGDNKRLDVFYTDQDIVWMVAR